MTSATVGNTSVKPTGESIIVPGWIVTGQLATNATRLPASCMVPLPPWISPRSGNGEVIPRLVPLSPVIRISVLSRSPVSSSLRTIFPIILSM